MATNLQCCLCGNNWGERQIPYRQGRTLITVYVCAVCCGDESDYEIFKRICRKNGKEGL